MRALYRLLRELLTFPYLVMYLVSARRSVVTSDVKAWVKAFAIPVVGVKRQFVHLFTYKQEFRNLFYARLSMPEPFQFLAPKRADLFIVCPRIGEGLVIQHGFASILLARSIGQDCWINQQVTLGASEREGSPTIGDRVRIGAGAKVLGEVKIGNDVAIGANSVVVKSVPPNCTVVGVPARIVRRDGIRVDEAL